MREVIKHPSVEQVHLCEIDEVINSNVCVLIGDILYACYVITKALTLNYILSSILIHNYTSLFYSVLLN